MTREEATTEAAFQQRSHPDATWLAVQREGEWTVVRIALAPTAIRPTGTATKPPPEAPRDAPNVSREIATRLYGGIR